MVLKWTPADHEQEKEATRKHAAREKVKNSCPILHHMFY
jgi:hypothetical protein